MSAKVEDSDIGWVAAITLNECCLSNSDDEGHPQDIRQPRISTLQILKSFVNLTH